MKFSPLFTQIATLFGDKARTITRYNYDPRVETEMEQHECRMRRLKFAVTNYEGPVPVTNFFLSGAQIEGSVLMNNSWEAFNEFEKIDPGLVLCNTGHELPTMQEFINALQTAKFDVPKYGVVFRDLAPVIEPYLQEGRDSFIVGASPNKNTIGLFLTLEDGSIVVLRFSE